MRGAGALSQKPVTQCDNKETPGRWGSAGRSFMRSTHAPGGDGSGGERCSGSVSGGTTLIQGDDAPPLQSDI
jgi:hypothetical protein